VAPQRAVEAIDVRLHRGAAADGVGVDGASKGADSLAPRRRRGSQRAGSARPPRGYRLVSVRSSRTLGCEDLNDHDWLRQLLDRCKKSGLDDHRRIGRRLVAAGFHRGVQGLTSTSDKLLVEILHMVSLGNPSRLHHRGNSIKAA
jgi:hypothetical protein